MNADTSSKRIQKPLCEDLCLHFNLILLELSKRFRLNAAVKLVISTYGRCNDLSELADVNGMTVLPRTT
jgi:hypothetical protein